MKKTVKVGIHDGTFHADDMFAIAALTRIYDVHRIRSRDEDVLRNCDILVDVGNIYDHEICRFDHHQSGGAGSRPNGIPYAGFGLVWKHYGELICGSSEVAELVDRLLVQPIDADDNGINLCSVLLDAEIQPYTVSQMILDHNPRVGEQMDEDTAFYMALVIAHRVLENVIAKAKTMLLTIPRIVRKAIEDAGGDQVVVLEQDCGRDWQETLIAEAPDTRFVVFQSKEDDWRVHAVPKTAGSFEYRLKLPESWGGLSREVLAVLTGVEDVNFCHPKCFIAGAKSKAGAIKLAKLTLTGATK